MKSNCLGLKKVLAKFPNFFEIEDAQDMNPMVRLRENIESGERKQKAKAKTHFTKEIPRQTKAARKVNKCQSNQDVQSEQEGFMYHQEYQPQYFQPQHFQPQYYQPQYFQPQYYPPPYYGYYTQPPETYYLGAPLVSSSPPRTPVIYSPPGTPVSDYLPATPDRASYPPWR
jgi:hypothetical protein